MCPDKSTGSQNKSNFDVLVLGAGAAGLMCALTAGQRGQRVLVLETSGKAGKKILMSGGGRCNFTNMHTTADDFLSSNPHFCKSALSQYTQWDFVALVEQHGISYHEKAPGQLFCDDSSKQILAMLLSECEQASVRIVTRCDIESVTHNSQYSVQTSRGRFVADKLVVATGGLSVPTLGGSGFAYELARQFRLRVLPVSPGLVPFTFSDYMRDLSQRLSGLSLLATASSDRAAFTENILFTHRGLSGPAILKLSSHWSSGEQITLDLLPASNMATELAAARKSHPRGLMRTLLARYLPRKLVLELEGLWWEEAAERPVAEWSGAALALLAERLHGWKLKPSGTEGYRTAEVTLGGVDTDALSSKTLEVKGQPGLYFVGEALDVTGNLGGFNFQWAWSSGYVAGMSV